MAAGATAENYQLKWHSFSSHLHSCVAASLTEHTFADVSLYTIDGHQILAHRFVLSACSQYLHQILKTQPKITSTLPLLIVMPPEINYKTLKTLIQYMYSGETTVSKDILENVLRGGDILKVRGLWRPKEDEQYDKIIKLHQKYTEIPQNSHGVNGVQSNLEKSEKRNNTNQTKTMEKDDVKKKAEVSVKQANENQNSVIKVYENKRSNNQGSPEDSLGKKSTMQEEENSVQYLMIKEEPIDWAEAGEVEMELIDEKEIFHTEMTIKPEVLLDTSEEQNEELYTPLTCELCTETFSHPADWVKHIQTHTDMLPAKRQRHGREDEDNDNSTFPPLHCDMCQKYFPTPAEWVHHIQNTHTEIELRLYNKSSPVKPIKVCRQYGVAHKVCGICNKTFPSHASMLIHRRTHTGEKPYMCKYCSKGFNVKSNLLRHLRTLHDKIINSTEIESKEESSSYAGKE